MRGALALGIIVSRASSLYTFDDLSHPIQRFSTPSYPNATDEGPNVFDVAQVMLDLTQKGTNSRNVNDFAAAFLGLIVMDVLDLELGNESWGGDITACNKFKDSCCSGNSTWVHTRFATYQEQTGTILNKGNGLLDMSFLYGSDNTSALNLRGVNGQLRTDASLRGLPHDNITFITGDRRVNEHPIFAAVTTLFLREHNRLAQHLVSVHSDWTSDQIYNEARRWNIAYWQKIVFYEFLGALSGGALSGSASTFKSTTSVNVTDVFVVAAWAMPMTMSDRVLRLDAFNNEVAARHVPIASAVGNAMDVLAGDADTVLRGMLAQAPPPAVNFPASLPAIPGSFFFRGDDSPVATAILEGRDLGLRDLRGFLTSLNRAASINLTMPSSWNALLGGSASATAASLQSLYGNVANCDPLVALLAALVNPGASIDTFFNNALRTQLQRARDGDPQYFEHPAMFSTEEQREIFSVHLKEIMQRNTLISNVPDQAFFRKPAIEIVHGTALTEVPVVFSDKHSGYAFSETPSPGYKISWTVFDAEDGSQHIRVLVEAKTLGWVGWGIGVSGTQAMINTDMVYATIIGGNASIADSHSLGVTWPPPDTMLGGENNLYDTGAAEVNGFTQMWFSRALIATEIHDHTIPEDLVKYTFAYNAFGTDFGYHGATRGIAMTQVVRKAVVMAPALVITFRFFASLLIAICVLLGILTIVKRNAVVFKAASPPFCLYFLLGAVIAISSIYPLTAQHTCSASLWLVSFGLSVMFAAIFVKNLRLANIFSSPSMKALKRQWSPRVLASMVVLVSAVPTVILIVMEAVDPARLVEVAHPTIAYALKEQCEQSHQQLWIGLLVSYLGILLGCGLHIASSLWSVKYEAFNEAGGIILAVNQFAVLAIVFVPALLALEFTENVFGSLQCVALLFAVTFAVAALFGWKVWIVVRQLQGSELASLKKDENANDNSKPDKLATFRTTGGSSAFLPRAGGRQSSRERAEKRVSGGANSNHSNHSFEHTPGSQSPNSSQNNDAGEHLGTELTSPKPKQEEPATPQLCLIITDADKEIEAAPSSV